MFESIRRMVAAPAPVATEADVRSAYRLLLGRDADAAGLASQLRWVNAEKPTPEQLAIRFIASEEYRAKNGGSAELVPVDRGGYTVFARRGDQLIGAAIINGTPYEPNVIDVFKNTLASGASVLDIGANIGIFSMLAAHSVGSLGKVIAVEPLPQNHRALYAGIVHNRFSNVEVLPFAASDKAGLISVRCAPDSSNGIVGAAQESEDPSAFVPTQRLDDILSTLARLDVVKMDIEGHEPAAWNGMQTLLARHRPRIFSEFSPIAMRNVGHDAEAYLRLLFGYAPRLRVLHRDVDAVECASPEAVMQEWRKANQRMQLNGELHLDLLVQPS